MEIYVVYSENSTEHTSRHCGTSVVITDFKGSAADGLTLWFKEITFPYPEPDRSRPRPHPTSRKSILILSSHLRVGLPSGLLPSGFLPKILYAPFISPICATYPAYLRLVTFSEDLILLVILTQVLELLYFGRANRIRKTSEKWTADVIFNVSLNLKITGVSGSSSSMQTELLRRQSTAEPVVESDWLWQWGDATRLFTTRARKCVISRYGLHTILITRDIITIIIVIIISQTVTTISTSKNHSSVGIANCYGLDGPGIESRQGRDFPHPSRPALEAHPAS